MDTYLPEGREIHLPEEEEQQSENRGIEVVGRESQTSEPSDDTYLSQLEEDKKNGHKEQVQEERQSSPSTITWLEEETQREVRRSVREKRPTPIFTYESLGQPSLQTHVESIFSQPTSTPLPFIPHMHSQFILPTAYTPHMYMPYTYYMPVTTHVY